MSHEQYIYYCVMYVHFMQAAFSGFLGEVWSTYSTISGMSFGIILGADMKSNESMTVGPTDAGFLQVSGSLEDQSRALRAEVLHLTLSL